MLLTTYFSKIKEIPEDYTKLVITRFPPKWLNVEEFPKMHLCKGLSPTASILNKYKKTNDWDEYKRSFKKEMLKKGTECKRYFELVKRHIEKGNNLCLICYEKDYKHCHRYIIAKELEKRGIEWKEL